MITSSILITSCYTPSLLKRNDKHPFELNSSVQSFKYQSNQVNQLDQIPLNPKEKATLTAFASSFFWYATNHLVKAYYLYYAFNLALLNYWDVDYEIKTSPININYNHQTKKFDFDFTYNIQINSIGNINKPTSPAFFQPAQANSNLPVHKQTEHKYWFTKQEQIKPVMEDLMQMRISYQNVNLLEVLAQGTSKTKNHAFSLADGSFYRYVKMINPTKEQTTQTINGLVYDNQLMNIDWVEIDGSVQLFKSTDKIFDEVFQLPNFFIANPRILTKDQIFLNEIQEFKLKPLDLLLPVFLNQDNQQPVQTLNQTSNFAKLQDWSSNHVGNPNHINANKRQIQDRAWILYDPLYYFDLTFEPTKPPGSFHCHADGYCH